MATKSTPTQTGVKYLVVPTWVTDERTGDRRHYKAHELIRLYGLKPRTYRVVDDRPSVPESIERAKRQGLVVLYPDPTGKYKLPEAHERGKEKPEEAPAALTDQIREANQAMHDIVNEQPLPVEERPKVRKKR
jgi:hypothetical protein